MKIFKNFGALFLTAVIVVSCADIQSMHSRNRIPINDVNFPDENFRNYIRNAFDKDRNGFLSDEEMAYVRNIHCENMNISSLTGIEHFPNLIGLWCLNNHIKGWDLSGNPHLKGIWCSHNDFTQLDFSACPELEWVYCFNCKLTSLNIKNNPELGYLECNANPNLKNLDLSGNPNLENLFCSECGLTSLDLSHNPKLCELDAFKNKLKSLNFSNNLKLKRLDVWDNKDLGDVDISKLSGLQFYNCAKNNVTKIDMSHNPELTMLICSYNENLTSINISQNPKLAFLNLECDWRLPSLDISHNPKLYHLYAFGLRGISKIDISNNSRLLKTAQKGVQKREAHLGSGIYSYTINYGGSGDYFDDLRHELVIDGLKDEKLITNNRNGSADSYDINLNYKDDFYGTESFATRGEAIQLLYEKAGKPYVSGYSTFNDVSNSASYAKAVKWGQDFNICFGSPNICSDEFKPNQLITRQEFALMAHRLATYLSLGTAFDYGRTDWFQDFYDIDFYAWGPFTWAIQFKVVKTKDDINCYPRGRLTKDELIEGVNQIFNLDEAASYSARVNGNGV